jgi:hypothetical protein
MLKSPTSESAGLLLDAVNMIAGITLVLSPWFLGYTVESYAAWNAWVAGAAIALIAVGALVAFHDYEEWANLIIGLWTVVAPWVLGFSALTAAVWVHVIAGLVVAIVAAARLWVLPNRPLSTV